MGIGSLGDENDKFGDLITYLSENSSEPKKIL